jgi:hypothetical protein
MSILKLIASDSFITVNVQVIQKVGLHEAIVLGHLASMHNYHKGEWFFQTQKQIEERTTLGRKPVTAAINKLTELGILETENRGMPCKKYFKLNEEALGTILFDPKEQTSMSQKDKQVCPKGSRNKNKTNKNKNNKPFSTDVPEDKQEAAEKDYVKRWIDAFFDMRKERGDLPTLAGDKQKLYFSCKAYADKAVKRYGMDYIRELWEFAGQDDYWYDNLNHLKQLDTVHVRYQAYKNRLKNRR